MIVIEETIAATLDSNGGLHLAQQPHLPPGPVSVTIRVAAAVSPQRTLADVIREIAAEQRARGFSGRSEADFRTDDDTLKAEDTERDQKLDSARHPAVRGDS